MNSIEEALRNEVMNQEIIEKYEKNIRKRKKKNKKLKTEITKLEKQNEKLKKDLYLQKKKYRRLKKSLQIERYYCGVNPFLPTNVFDMFKEGKKSKQGGILNGLFYQIEGEKKNRNTSVIDTVFRED